MKDFAAHTVLLLLGRFDTPEVDVEPECGVHGAHRRWRPTARFESETKHAAYADIKNDHVSITWNKPRRGQPRLGEGGDFTTHSRSTTITTLSLFYDGLNALDLCL